LSSARDISPDVNILTAPSGEISMNGMNLLGSRASWLRILAMTHILATIIFAAMALFVDPSWAGQWLNTFGGTGYNVVQRMLLFVCLGFGGVHIAIGLAAVLVVIALSGGRSPASQSRLLTIYLAVTGLFFVTKVVGWVGFQLQGVMLGSGAATEAGGWAMVGMEIGWAALICLPAIVILLSGCFNRCERSPVLA